MKKRFGFVLTLALCAALSVGVAPQASAVGTTYNINAVADWPSGGSITLLDGDTLNISPAAESPIAPVVVFINANANVTINGGGVMRTDVCFTEFDSDRAQHTVTINDLQIAAPNGWPAYSQYMGKLNLVGTNVFIGPPNRVALQAITAASGLWWESSIVSASGGTLKVTTVSTANSQVAYALMAGKLNVQGTAHVTLTSSGTDPALFVQDAINIDSGASLTVTATNNIAIIAQNPVVTNWGVLTVDGGNMGDPALHVYNGSSMINMGVGAVTSITSTIPETDSYTMIPTSGYQWQVSGGASLVSPDTVMSSPASITVAGGTTGVVKLAPIVPLGTAMYRIYSPMTGEHFYTSSAREVQVNVNSGAWKYEGVGWVAPLSGTQVYRLAAIPGSGSAGHLFTTSAKERDAALASVNPAGHPYWKCETGAGMPACVGWYSGGTIPVFRAYFPGNGQHNYTTDSNEQRVITGTGLLGGWTDEGIGWFGVATGDPGAPMPVV